MEKGHKYDYFQAFSAIFRHFSRDDWIRTSGLFVPNEARYRAALHPEKITRKYIPFCSNIAPRNTYL